MRNIRTINWGFILAIVTCIAFWVATIGLVQNAMAFAGSPAQSKHVATVVNRSFAQQVRTRLSLGGGYHLLSTSVKCAPAYDGTPGGYVCQGTFTATAQGLTMRFGCMIYSGSSGYTWHEQGKPWLIRQW